VAGALEGSRITVLSGGTKYSRRMRLCAEHLTRLLGEDLSQFEVLGDEGPVSDQEMCPAPGHDSSSVPGPCSGFAWAYRRGQPPIELYTPLCEAHALELISARALREEPILV
jgi:hypothetical protein